MKATGIVRQVDPLGRIVLPKELRRTLGIAEKDSLEIYTDGDAIILKKYQRGCMLCCSDLNLLDFKGIHICRGCARKVGKAAE